MGECRPPHQLSRDVETNPSETWRIQVVSAIFRALQGLAIVALVLLVSMALIYLPFSSYYDHCEAVVASLSWMLFQAEQPLYHGADAAARYSVSYGPMLYLLVGLPQLILGASISTSKVSGILACALAVILLWRTLRRNCESSLVLILIGWFSLFLLLFENYAYWNRPDPFLVLCVVFGLSGVSTPSLKAAATIVGVATGLAMNLKIHGAVYLLPVIALLLMRRPGRPDLMLAISCCVVVFAAPFLLMQISIVDYLQSLTVAPRHGLSVSMLLKSLSYALLLLTPLIGILLMRPHRELAPDTKILIGTFLITLIVVTAISSKRGAGPHHYLPALPTLVYICSLVLNGSGKLELLGRIRERGPARAGYLLLATSYMVIAAMAAQSQAGIAATLARDSEFRAASHELSRILTTYAADSIQMGYTDRNGYKYTHLRPLVVARGHPYWLDAVALMDYDAAGMALPDATIAALESCVTEVWILPATGAPFSMTNYYATGRNIFGDQFARAFSENYELVESTAHYAVWKCGHGPT